MLNGYIVMACSVSEIFWDNFLLLGLLTILNGLSCCFSQRKKIYMFPYMKLFQKKNVSVLILMVNMVFGKFLVYPVVEKLEFFGSTFMLA